MAEQQQVSTGGSSAAPMCANGCGFYGSAITKNFCSKCFKEIQAAKAVEAAAAEDKKATTSNGEATAAVEEKEATTIKPDSSSSKAAAAPPVTAASEAAAAAAKQEKKEEEAPAAPIQCAAGCGFFGSAATSNMCSKCYVDSIKTVHAAPELLEKIKAGKAALIAAEKQPAPGAEEAAPNRCQSCRKKVGMLGFTCRCGGLFCSMHRHSDKHACDFDFKTADREKIAKNNPLIVAPKINKI